jgi:hypothetical protein
MLVIKNMHHALFAILFFFISNTGLAQIRTISLNGIWQIAEGTGLTVPKTFDHSAPVPGLVDMAQPAFEEVGIPSSKREAFWYRKKFTLEGKIPSVAILKINQAMFGVRVIVNGFVMAERNESFVPCEVDIHNALKGDGVENEIIIRVLANRSDVPVNVISGIDFERIKYIPGIHDDVSLKLSGTPRITSVQTVPDIVQKTVRVQANIENTEFADVLTPITIRVKEALSGKIVSEKRIENFVLKAYEAKTVDEFMSVSNCKLWSPTSPFLYKVEITTNADSVGVRFGMRKFEFNPKTGFAELNGRTTYLNGTNLCMYRFMEDSSRGNLPWDIAWARKMFKKFKQLNWNYLRFTIGSPPAFWFDIADEEGIMIQNEYAVWLQPGFYPEARFLDHKEYASELKKWMPEYWNHASNVVWDAQNETFNRQTTPALEAVRHLDLSDRPWENGWCYSENPSDPQECHPYLFFTPESAVSYLQTVERKPLIPGWGDSILIHRPNPRIIDEYEWLWLDRTGAACDNSKDVYEGFLGKNSTEQQRRSLYARMMGVVTEFWRAQRQVAAVMEFSSLGYSRPNGKRNCTSDHWIDIKNLVFDPYFEKEMKNSFAPAIAIVDFYKERVASGVSETVPVIVLNDYDKVLKCAVSVNLTKDGKIISSQKINVIVEAKGSKSLPVTIKMPKHYGSYRIEAIRYGIDTVKSFRDITVFDSKPFGKALFKNATASSFYNNWGIRYLPQYAIDGNEHTSWTSNPENKEQWLAVDFGNQTTINSLKITWGDGFPLHYEIQTADERGNFNTVFKQDNGQGKTETVLFNKPEHTQKIRLLIPMQEELSKNTTMNLVGIKTAIEQGYSVRELKVF